MDIRSIQKPLKDRYRQEASAAFITLHAEGSTKDTPIACSVDIGRALLEAEAHKGVGGGGGACSGDLLLGALAACAQITCQMVAAAMNITTNDIKIVVDGDLDLRGTLGFADVPVGFSEIRLRIAIDAPEADPAQLQSLFEKTEKYCVVLQTLLSSTVVKSSMELTPTV